MSAPAASPDTLDGYCLAEDVIHALACGGLEEKQRSKALAHLDECELCQALLADEVRDMPLSASADDPGLPTLIQLDALVAGRYRIQHFVARGGMGEVYEAWDELLAERVALKTINPLVASADQARATARFRQEVQLSRRVADAHVCRIYEFGQHLVRGFGAVSYLTMEFIEGQTLGARLRQGPQLTMPEVLDLSRQMLRGLGAAHSVGVLHRDFKSDNVMLRDRPPSSGGWHAVIMDFGLARVLGDQAHRFTERHELVGSAAYMAPEQLEEGGELSEATDIYAFGVVLFEMLTGRLPFEGSAPVAVALRRLSHPAPPPSMHLPELDGAWDELVLRCLERDPSRRFTSTDEAIAALDALESGGPRRQRRRQDHRRRLFAATAAGAVLVGGLSLAASRGRSGADAKNGPVSAEAATPSVTLALEPQKPEEQKLEPQKPEDQKLEPGAAPAATTVEPLPAPAPSAQRTMAGETGVAPMAVLDPPASDPRAPEPVEAGSQPGNGAPEPASAAPAPPVSAAARPSTKARRASPRPAAAVNTSPAPVPAPHAEASSAAAPSDVRDIFFLEAPSEPRSEH